MKQGQNYKRRFSTNSSSSEESDYDDSDKDKTYTPNRTKKSLFDYSEFYSSEILNNHATTSSTTINNKINTVKRHKGPKGKSKKAKIKDNDEQDLSESISNIDSNNLIQWDLLPLSKEEVQQHCKELDKHTTILDHFAYLLKLSGSSGTCVCIIKKKILVASNIMIKNGKSEKIDLIFDIVQYFGNIAENHTLNREEKSTILQERIFAECADMQRGGDKIDINVKEKKNTIKEIVTHFISTQEILLPPHLTSGTKYVKKAYRLIEANAQEVIRRWKRIEKEVGSQENNVLKKTLAGIYNENKDFFDSKIRKTDEGEENKKHYIHIYSPFDDHNISCIYKRDQEKISDNHYNIFLLNMKDVASSPSKEARNKSQKNGEYRQLHSEQIMIECMLFIIDKLTDPVYFATYPAPCLYCSSAIIALNTFINQQNSSSAPINQFRQSSRLLYSANYKKLLNEQVCNPKNLTKCDEWSTYYLDLGPQQKSAQGGKLSVSRLRNLCPRQDLLENDNLDKIFICQHVAALYAMQQSIPATVLNFPVKDPGRINLATKKPYERKSMRLNIDPHEGFTYAYYISSTDTDTDTDTEDKDSDSRCNKTLTLPHTKSVNSQDQSNIYGNNSSTSQTQIPLVQNNVVNTTNLLDPSLPPPPILTEFGTALNCEKDFYQCLYWINEYHDTYTKHKEDKIKGGKIAECHNNIINCIKDTPKIVQHQDKKGNSLAHYLVMKFGDNIDNQIIQILFKNGESLLKNKKGKTCLDKLASHLQNKHLQNTKESIQQCVKEQLNSRITNTSAVTKRYLDNFLDKVKSLNGVENNVYCFLLQSLNQCEEKNIYFEILNKLIDDEKIFTEENKQQITEVLISLINTSKIDLKIRAKELTGSMQKLEKTDQIYKILLDGIIQSLFHPIQIEKFNLVKDAIVEIYKESSEVLKELCLALQSFTLEKIQNNPAIPQLLSLGTRVKLFYELVQLKSSLILKEFIDKWPDSDQNIAIIHYKPTAKNSFNTINKQPMDLNTQPISIVQNLSSQTAGQDNKNQLQDNQINTNSSYFHNVKNKISSWICGIPLDNFNPIKHTGQHHHFHDDYI